jgi:hypothetical protein
VCVRLGGSGGAAVRLRGGGRVGRRAARAAAALGPIGRQPGPKSSRPQRPHTLAAAAGAPALERLEGLRGPELAAACVAGEAALHSGGAPHELLARAARDPSLLAGCAAATLSMAARPLGLAHLLGLPWKTRFPVARALLHAAVCHLYAQATAADAAALQRAAAGPGGAEGGGAGDVWWPYTERCSEPLFALLSPQHQWWLACDVLGSLWAPPEGSDDGGGGSQ